MATTAPTATAPFESWTAIQVIMMPSDANPVPVGRPLSDGSPSPGFTTVFGGVILSYIDVAGSIAARREILHRGGVDASFVTVAINRVEFKKPVLVGDVVRFVTTVTRVGRTSVTVHIDVIAERGRDTITVTDAEVVYVGVETNLPPLDRRPVPLFPTTS
ncbi:MAG: acyl-CoA thioesterase [Gemmataceae bacterium]